MLLHVPNQRYKQSKIKKGQNDLFGNSSVNELHSSFTQGPPWINVTRNSLWIDVRSKACDLNQSGPNSGTREACSPRRALVRLLNTLCMSHFLGNAKYSDVEKLQRFS